MSEREKGGQDVSRNVASDLVPVVRTRTRELSTLNLDLKIHT